MDRSTRERRTPRRMFAVLATIGLVAGGLSLVMPAAGAAPPSCQAQNLTMGSKASGDLQHVIDQAPPGSSVKVKGTCAGNFVIGKDITLLGPATLTTDGNHIGTVLHITSGTISIKSLTITKGVASVEAFLFNNGQSQKLCCSGGGIAVEGASTSVVLTDSLVTDNVAPAPWGRGGGISITGGTLTLTNSTVSDNSATNSGGIDSNFAAVTLNNSTVSRNKATGGEKFCQATAACAGGIWNYFGTLILNNSTISGNSAYWRGGGIVNQGSDGVLTLSGRTTITGNQVGPLPAGSRLPPARGGGIYQRGGFLQHDWQSYVVGNFSVTSDGTRTPDECWDQAETLCSGA